MHLIGELIIGGLAGWIAGLIVSGSGFGLIGDIVVGVIGGFIGSRLAGMLHIIPPDGWLWDLITAVVGAAVLLVIIKFVKSAFGGGSSSTPAS